MNSDLLVTIILAFLALWLGHNSWRGWRHGYFHTPWGWRRLGDGDGDPSYYPHLIYYTVLSVLMTVGVLFVAFQGVD